MPNRQGAEVRAEANYLEVKLCRHTSSIVSMNAWASPPERPWTLSTSLSSEKIVVIRETRLSMVRVSPINLFQVG